jgi:hypothetical protein
MSDSTATALYLDLLKLCLTNFINGAAEQKPLQSQQRLKQKIVNAFAARGIQMVRPAPFERSIGRGSIGSVGQVWSELRTTNGLELTPRAQSLGRSDHVCRRGNVRVTPRFSAVAICWAIAICSGSSRGPSCCPPGSSSRSGHAARHHPDSIVRRSRLLLQIVSVYVRSE